MVHPLLFNSETLVLEFLYFPSGGIIFEVAHSTSSLYLVRLEATREKIQSLALIAPLFLTSYLNYYAAQILNSFKIHYKFMETKY